jgi:hypothetical protein
MKESYSQKLLDPRWKIFRDSIVARDSKMCRKCQSEKHLEVHHCYYDFDKEPWDYNPLSLITLCSDCHDYETKNLKIMQKMLLDSLGKKGLLAQGYDSLAFAFECANIWPEDRIAWQALSWAIRTPEIMNSIISFYQENGAKNV